MAFDFQIGCHCTFRNNNAVHSSNAKWSLSSLEQFSKWAPYESVGWMRTCKVIQGMFKVVLTRQVECLFKLGDLWDMSNPLGIMESGKSALLIFVVQSKVFISKLYFVQGFGEQLQIRLSTWYDPKQSFFFFLTGTDGLILVIWQKVCMLIWEMHLITDTCIVGYS